MTDTVIRVENLGKKYVLNHQQQERYVALRDVIANRARAFAQKPLQYLAQRRAESPQEEFWALKDVSFEIRGIGWGSLAAMGQLYPQRNFL